MASARADRALIILAAGFAILILALLLAIGASSRQQRGFSAVVRTLEIENQLGMVLSRLQDAETGARGYLLTGRPAYLEPYNAALAHLDPELDILKAELADDPKQGAALVRLRSIAAERQRVLKDSIDLYDKGDREAAASPARLDRGKALMDSARVVVASMKSEQDQRLTSRNTVARRWASVILAGLLAIILALFVLGGFVRRDLLQRLAEARAARQALADEAAQREAAQSQIRQMQKVEAIGQLTGGIAHDFNNMLAIVIGSLDVAKRNLAKDPRKAETFIDAAFSGAQRAAALTARLLAFSRQQPLAPEVVDANKLTATMSELLRRTLGEHVELETVLAGGLWRTRIDPGQLENALLNLSVNARDAMPDGGRLTLETSNAHLDEAYVAGHVDVAPGQYVMLSVTDTGTGMPPEVVENAFDPFYTTKGSGKGTGLGLSQVHGFVKQSGGHIKIYSEVGVGTTVKVYLPRYVGAEPPKEAAPAPLGDVPVARPGETILVVEDETDVRQLSVNVLRDLGYLVLHADDPRRALEKIADLPKLDLLFTDIVMPGMNGRQLALKAVEARPGLKVLYTTGYTRNAIVHNGVLDADVSLLAKPFTVEQLPRKVREILDGGPGEAP
ncbi:CHASE3 domain-containing protein [Phenylobacterium sp.]|uniref:CHASE3 domain-containing protein n=1 Tax=Phenylobacterium sp. TaxID=1871053 RepID=UPI002B7BFEA4|nr:CHASE3 domain-containing protein [Phenylobacterium sp.]HLZ76505.1 CHASE3 domain-containing protein [Phenylobacterium sp.]